ncbi:hypothetical protein ACPA9J_18230 [Pseudomonas aeruginosa]
MIHDRWVSSRQFLVGGGAGVRAESRTRAYPRGAKQQSRLTRGAPPLQSLPAALVETRGDLPGLPAFVHRQRRRPARPGRAPGPPAPPWRRRPWPSPVYRSPDPGAAAADRHHPSFRHVRLSARGPRRARGWR